MTPAAHSRTGTFRGWWRSVLVGVAASGLALAGPAHADRLVLAPRGLVAAPASLGAEYALQPSDDRAAVGWLTFGLPQEDLGLEIEAERRQVSGRTRTGLSAQYSLTGNAFSDIAPAVSVGVRDALNTGREGRALFVSMTKTFGLSPRQERLLRDLKVTAGYGTSRMDGVFLGVQARVAPGLWAAAEVVSRRFNASLSLPLTRQFSVKAYTLGGDLYVGAALAVSR